MLVGAPFFQYVWGKSLKILSGRIFPIAPVSALLDRLVWHPGCGSIVTVVIASSCSSGLLLVW